ncbi:uracil-DNA glycosylase [Falsirhodobacter halotolerans]|uniref:uracil-DNA glycosylase n=1 Tax=Falsirhodobacter halotolerans TaxID=1146892 RepID=UPI001FD1718F|nr:uracil-DNA glycosylase [Falsirhodobacter halotolerans]MCJ8138814.1 uracil-DNA glycosylase [Falsirhodobacter halotolerans]
MERDACDLDFETAAAMLAWQVDLGVLDVVGDAPLNRYELEAVAPKPTPVAAPPVVVEAPDPVAEARAMAAAAPDLETLAEVVADYPHCELKRGARNTVFCDGRAGARVMIVGEAPGRDEDMQGRPFVGRAGQMLDRMLAAIGLARDNPDITRAVYITNVMPWRPPQNRDPTKEEVAMMRPFLSRHIELAAPDLLIVLGNTSAQAVLGKTGITRLRGTWHEGFGLPVRPMLHPAYLLRNPAAKREAWADLLDIQARLT